MIIPRVTSRFASCAAQSARSRTYASAAGSPLKRTALYDFHVKNQGKMVEFAGWDMPVQYGGLGVLASHFWTREKASLFDVSHMLQTRWTGKDHIKFIESLVVGDIQGLPTGSSTLSLFTNENGGIIDDTVINRQDAEGLYVVSNAGCADKDLAHIRAQLKKFQDKGGDVDVKVLDDVSLVALQGPSAPKVVSSLTGQDLSSFGFMTSRRMEIKGIPVYISRCGYTGEDGFEISVPHSEVVRLSELFLEHPDVELAGLGARDSLRLEAGLCLYGHDLDDTTSPIEAGLTWTIGKRRREEGGFLGAEKILPQIKGGVPRRRVGLVVEGAPAREGAELFNTEGEAIGKITSGCPSPVLKKNIAMGYVKSGFHKQGTDVQVQVRNRMQKAKITKMPFVPHQWGYQVALYATKSWFPPAPIRLGTEEEDGRTWETRLAQASKVARDSFLMLLAPTVLVTAVGGTNTLSVLAWVFFLLSVLWQLANVVTTSPVINFAGVLLTLPFVVAMFTIAYLKGKRE
ncbi:hypothetical protein HK104_004817 [Borealophlyctis nickersoniae]|nr:hypothetical protein HK104_004817 [Borealophlyctis nickersoniae]